MICNCIIYSVRCDGESDPLLWEILVCLQSYTNGIGVMVIFPFVLGAYTLYVNR